MIQALTGVASSVLPMLGGFFGSNNDERLAWEQEMRNRQLAIEQQELQARQQALQLAAAQYEGAQKAAQTRMIIFGGLGALALILGFVAFRPKTA